MSTAHRQKARFKVGDYVSFRYGLRQIWAQVIEDRGAIGVDGRRIHRIRFGDESDEVVAFEVPEVDLDPVEIDQAQVAEYLKQGGLLDILRANLGGGRGQPKAWLAPDQHGNLFFTFSPERGIIGGETIPFFALQGYQVFTPKAEEVARFLSSFGLTGDQAEEVIRSVGTTP